jgi:RHS repeat-associated protein
MENTTTHYIFDEEEGALKGTLKYMHHRTIEGQAIQYLSYAYDGFARLVRTTEQRPSGTYITDLEYDECSRISASTYPTGVSIKNEYGNGYLRRILDADGHVLWKTNGINAYGQLTDAMLGNGTTTHRAYKEDMHYLDSIVTSNNLQNLSYGYDNFGNLASRKDNLRNLEETFQYDKMNRLTDICLGNTHSQIVYDALSRMTSKQADGQTVFANADFTGVPGQPVRPHAMKSAATADGVFPTASQTITYTSSDKVKSIGEDGKGLVYTYGYDHQRIRAFEAFSDHTVNKDYVGVCEYITEDHGAGGATFKTLTYLVGPFGVFAVVEKQNNEESIHYILKDHLGSWTTITDSEGNVEQELSYDAWGNLRNPATWSGSFSGTPMFDRGFTGHEHMTAFGLINMNGRCYDPLTSSFLSVDAYVQDPASAQAFNRYAYCNYTPLRYTDPTGWYRDGYGREPRPQCYDPTTRYHSDDPNDVLWGRSVHPCGNSSSGYVNGTAVTSTGYTQGNNGLHGSNYTVDKQGYVKYEGGNNTPHDVLYCADAFYSGDFSNGLIVYDLSILSGLTDERSDYRGNYTATTSKKEAFDVFYFMAENTEVEWGIDGYRVSGGNEYVIRTSNDEWSVTNLYNEKYNKMNCVFMMHSHCWPDGTKGASKLLIGNTWGKCDMASITSDYNFYERQGMKNINVWFKYQDTYTVFPKHYVYHKYSNNLYFYDVWVNNYFIRKINKANDFYRNLGF